MGNSKEKTLAEKRAEAKESIEKFEFKMTGIRHAKPEIVRFRWRNRTVDLRTIPEALAKVVAADENNGVLEFTKAGEAANKKASDDESVGKSSEKKK